MYTCTIEHVHAHVHVAVVWPHLLTMLAVCCGVAVGLTCDHSSISPAETHWPVGANRVGDKSYYMHFSLSCVPSTCPPPYTLTL